MPNSGYDGAKAPALPTNVAEAAGLPKPIETKNEFKVGDKYFDAKEPATKLAERQSATVMDRFYGDIAPKMVQAYTAQGRLDKAEQMSSFLEDRGTKQGMKHWAKGMALMNMGDVDGALSSLMDAQHTAGFGTDLKIKGWEPIKDQAGKAVGGIRVNYTNDNGVDGYQDFANKEDFAMTAVNLLSPEKQFAIYDARQKAAMELRAKSAEKNSDLKRDLYKIDYKDTKDRGAKSEELNLRAKLGLGAGREREPYTQDKSPTRIYREAEDYFSKLSGGTERFPVNKHGGGIEKKKWRELTDDQKRYFIERKIKAGTMPGSGETTEDGLPLL